MYLLDWRVGFSAAVVAVFAISMTDGLAAEPCLHKEALTKRRADVSAENRANLELAMQTAGLTPVSVKLTVQRFRVNAKSQRPELRPVRTNTETTPVICWTTDRQQSCDWQFASDKEGTTYRIIIHENVQRRTETACGCGLAPKSPRRNPSPIPPRHVAVVFSVPQPYGGEKAIEVVKTDLQIAHEEGLCLRQSGTAPIKKHSPRR